MNHLRFGYIPLSICPLIGSLFACNPYCLDAYPLIVRQLENNRSPAGGHSFSILTNIRSPAGERLPIRHRAPNATCRNAYSS